MHTEPLEPLAELLLAGDMPLDNVSEGTLDELGQRLDAIARAKKLLGDWEAAIKLSLVDTMSESNYVVADIGVLVKSPKATRKVRPGATNDLRKDLPRLMAAAALPPDDDGAIDPAAREDALRGVTALLDNITITASSVKHDAPDLDEEDWMTTTWADKVELIPLEEIGK